MNDISSLSRKKDLVATIVASLISAIVFILIKINFEIKSLAVLLSYVFAVSGIVLLLLAYFESRSDDPFVTGKTQTMGVMNSFVALIAVIVLGSFRFGLIPVMISMDILVLLARELGRRSRRKLIDKYINRAGKITKDRGKGKYVMNIDSEDVEVYSKEPLMVGNHVRVSDMKGTYLYVEKVA